MSSRGCLDVCGETMETVDFFPTPANKTFSPLGGVVSVISLLGMCAVVGLGIWNMTEETQTVSRVPIASSFTHPFESPPMLLEIRRNGQSWFDANLVRVKYQQRNIYESDSNPARPRTRETIPTINCTIPNGFSSDIEGYCPERSGDIIGEYSSPVYSYINIVFEAAPSANITQLLNILNTEYITISLWIFSTKSRTFAKWRSSVYFSYEPNSWMGIETYIHVVKSRKYDWKGGLRDEEYSHFHDSSTRRSSSQILTDGEIVKFYIRADDDETEETVQVYNLSIFAAFVGGVWSIVVATVGSCALLYNSRLAEKRRKKRLGMAALAIDSPDGALLMRAINDKFYKEAGERGVQLKEIKKRRDSKMGELGLRSSDFVKGNIESLARWKHRQSIRSENGESFVRSGKLYSQPKNGDLPEGRRSSSSTLGQRSPREVVVL